MTSKNIFEIYLLHNKERPTTDWFDVYEIKNESLPSVQAFSEAHNLQNAKPENAFVQAKIKSESKRISAHQVSQWLVGSGIQLLRIDEAIHAYDTQTDIFVCLEGPQGEAFIRRTLPEKFCNQVNTSTISESIKWLRSRNEVPIITADMERKRKEHVHFQNGTWNISQGRFIHDNIVFTTRLVVEYKQQMNDRRMAPTFFEYLEKAFGKHSDCVERLQEILGLAVSEIRDQKHIIFLLGPHDCGKSVLLTLIRNLIGDNNCAALPLSAIQDKFKSHMLQNKMVNLGSEMGSFNMAKMDMLKAISGNDIITVEEKGLPAFKMRNRALLIFGVNNLPDISKVGPDPAYFSRLIILPFEKSIPREAQIEDIHAKLAKEIQPIISFALQGLERYIKNGFRFSLCKKSDELLEDYQNLAGIGNQDSFRIFAEKLLIPDTDGILFSSEITEAYHEFCNARGLPYQTVQKWGRVIGKIFDIEKVRRDDANGRSVNAYRGIRLLSNLIDRKVD